MKNKALFITMLLPLLILACNLTSQPASNINEIKVEEMSETNVKQSEIVPTIQNVGPSLTLTAWQEPQMAAFSTNVPTGWIVDGGVNQSMGFQHPWLEMAEPNGRAAIIYGSRELQIFLLPHPELTQAGYPEGSTIQDNGFSITVVPYESGEQVAEKAVRNWMQPICANLTIDYAYNLNTFVSEGTVPSERMESSEGIVGFHCLVEGNTMTGEYILATHKVVDVTTGAGFWFSGNPTSFVSLESFKVQAEEAFSALRSNLTFNPQWQVGLMSIPGAAGLYYSVSEGNNPQEREFPFFEDRVADFCARNGGC